MPEFILDTSGQVEAPASVMAKAATQLWPKPLTWVQLDAFTQGYIEALFFTSEAPGVTSEEWQAAEDHDEGSIPGDVGFADLAPDALLSILKDCADFQRAHAALWADGEADDDQAGRDFWFTRNRHGVGFWDRDPEMYGCRPFGVSDNNAQALTDAAHACGEVDAYLGDDGKVWL